MTLPKKNGVRLTFFGQSMRIALDNQYEQGFLGEDYFEAGIKPTMIRMAPRGQSYRNTLVSSRLICLRISIEPTFKTLHFPHSTRSQTIGFPRAADCASII